MLDRTILGPERNVKKKGTVLSIPVEMRPPKLLAGNLAIVRNLG